MYIANHYVRVGGKVYKKGETIPEGLPKLKLDWLIGAKAIREVPDTNVGNMDVPQTEPGETGEEYEDAVEEPVTAEETEEEETEAPEIDVMAGIVQDEEPDKPAKKPAARKAAERRKSK